VHGGLSADHRDGARTDRFSRLDRGTIRAGALAYYPHHLAPPPAAPPPAAPVPPPTGMAGDAAPAGRPAHGAGPGTRDPGQPAALPARRRPRQTSPTRPAACGRRRAGRRAGRRRAAAAEPGRRRAGRPGRRRAFEAVLLAHAAPDAAPRRPSLPVAGEPAPSPAPGADAAAPPMIMGAYCKNGHFDDPDARYCAVAGSR